MQLHMLKSSIAQFLKGSSLKAALPVHGAASAIATHAQRKGRKLGCFSKDQLTWRAHVRRHSPLGEDDHFPDT